MSEETVFQLALEKSPSERPAFLDQACAGDAALRRRVEILLQAHDNPGSFLANPALEPADRPPPTLPGDYEIVREVGRGGMGVVYLANQKSLGRAVAVKVLRPGEATYAPLVKRFLEEARHLARLRHPNIVSIHEIGQAGTEPYFTMDYVEGQPLSALLARGKQSDGGRARLSPTQALALLKQVAAGVQHAHEHGIIHRDLKPGNILVDRSGQAYVTDFGLARDRAQSSKLTGSGEILGTPAYMAPEQARGQKELIGEATDVHALGVILYEMLTGRLPYGDGGPADVLVRLITDEPTPPRRLDRRIPRDLETICLKAMAKAPERRYASVRAFLEDIHRFESGEPVLARRPGPLVRGARFARRHWKVAAAVLVTAAALWAVRPWVVEKSAQELIQWGNEQYAAGQNGAALRTYARAYRRASERERRDILDLILRCARGMKDPKEVGEAIQDLVDVDPDVSFQEFDYAVAEAWGSRRNWNNMSGVSPEEVRRIVEVGVKRLQLVLGSTHSTDQQKKEAQMHLERARQIEAMLATAPDLVLGLPLGEPPAELLRRAAAADGSTLWSRGLAAFAAGFQLEQAGGKPAALAAYRQAYDLMRRACPTYSGLSFGINMGLPRDKQQEPKELRLVREVARAVRRLDPAAPDPLRGGIRFRIDGPQSPKNHWIFLNAALWGDPAIKPIDIGFGATTTPKGESWPLPPGQVPLQVDGTAWIGVADGKYRLAVWEGGSGGRGESDPGSKPVALDFEGVPAEVEIRGETVEVRIRSYVLEEITLLAPAADAALDLVSANFHWSSVAGAKYYRIEFWHTYPIPGGMRGDIVTSAKVDGTSFSLASLPAAEVLKFSTLRRGSKGNWSVAAYDAADRRITFCTARGFTVARELTEK
jgi:hypothetical protein